MDTFSLLLQPRDSPALSISNSEAVKVKNAKDGKTLGLTNFLLFFVGEGKKSLRSLETCSGGPFKNLGYSLRRGGQERRERERGREEAWTRAVCWSLVPSLSLSACLIQNFIARAWYTEVCVENTEGGGTYSLSILFLYSLLTTALCTKNSHRFLFSLDNLVRHKIQCLDQVIDPVKLSL